jgi:hypothetical protein
MHRSSNFLMEQDMNSLVSILYNKLFAEGPAAVFTKPFLPLGATLLYQMKSSKPKHHMLRQ